MLDDCVKWCNACEKCRIFKTNIPAIALDADELTFDTWMTCLRETSRTRCDQCGHIPSERIRETDLEYHAAIRETIVFVFSVYVKSSRL